MIELTLEAGLTFANLIDLHEWEKNPRTVKEEDYINLKRQMDLGEFKPLLIMEDGTILGGNTRVKAYREKGFTKVWVSIVTFEKGAEDQLYHAFVNGVEAKRTFEAVEQAMLEYALADNSSTGMYDSQQLAELAMPYQYDMPMEIYKVNLGFPVKMQSLLDSVQPTATPTDPSSRDVDVDTTDEKLDVYLQGSIRQIVLYFDTNQYEEVMTDLGDLIEKYGLENNTNVFLKLLAFYKEHADLDTSPVKAVTDAEIVQPADVEQQANAEIQNENNTGSEN